MSGIYCWISGKIVLEGGRGMGYSNLVSVIQDATSGGSYCEGQGRLQSETGIGCLTKIYRTAKFSKWRYVLSLRTNQGERGQSIAETL